MSRQPDLDIKRAVDLQNAGDNGAAAAIYDRLLQQYPSHPDILHFRGIIHRQDREYDQACALIARAIALEPTRSRAHYDVGVAMAASKRRADAKAHFETAVRLDPTLADAYYMLGVIERDAARHDVAIAHFQNAVALAPDFVDAYWALCAELREVGDVAASLKVADAGLARHPANAELHTYRSEALLSQGHFAEGWAEYIWRFKSGKAAIPDRTYAVPRWAGEPLAGRTIAIWSEQGIGDIVMYASMINDAAARARSCVVQVPSRLKALFERSFPRVTVVSGDDAAFPGAVDFETPIAGLGRWLRPTFESFGSGDSYLKPDRALVERLRGIYRGGDKVLLVGIAWRSTNVPHDTDKSLDLRFWGGLLNVPGVRFISLQYGDCATELESARQGFGVKIIRDETVDPLGDLDRHAAQIAAMDFVVSTANTAAHLAGALGVPTICMLPDTIGHGLRWHWYASRPSSPWYRSLERVCRPRDRGWSWPLAVAAVRLVEVAAAAGAMSAPGKYLGALANSYRRENASAELAHVLAARHAFEPANADVALDLAKVLSGRGETTRALAAIDHALRLAPNVSSAWNEQGQIQVLMGQFDQAYQSYERGLALAPESVPLLSNAGRTLRQLGRADDAVALYRRAIALEPARTSLHLNLAGALADAGKVDESCRQFCDLLKTDPENVEVHFQYARALLRFGHLDLGWRELRWRWRRPEVHVRPDVFGIKVWDGEELLGRKVLICTEQGIGEEILAATVVRDLCMVAGRVGILCSERMAPIFSQSFPDLVVATRVVPLPPRVAEAAFDFVMSISELGRKFRPHLAAFGAAEEVLKVNPDHVAALRRRYRARRPTDRLVGISWRSTHPEVGHLKSSRLEDWSSLLTVPGVTFVDLQYGDTATEREKLPVPVAASLTHDDSIDPLIDLGAAATQIAAMDLVITVSNTCAHLAGALGVPTWVLLNKTAGRFWYWFEGRPKSPWYKDVTLHAVSSAQLTAFPTDDIVARLRTWFGDGEGDAP